MKFEPRDLGFNSKTFPNCAMPVAPFLLVLCHCGAIGAVLDGAGQNVNPCSVVCFQWFYCYFQKQYASASKLHVGRWQLN
jgi:hypothetical protein